MAKKSIAPASFTPGTPRTGKVPTAPIQTTTRPIVGGALGINQGLEWNRTGSNGKIKRGK